MKKVLYLFLFGPMFSPALALAQDSEVAIKNYKFEPQNLTIKAGTKVTWKNTDQIPHGVADKNKKFRSPAMDTGDTYSFTYAAPGTYSYFCTLHPYMTGTVTVTQ